jgi:hypothetical protein
MPHSTFRSASWSLALLVLACASRDVPTSYPASSAAAPDSAPGQTLPVTRALASEPPLPGESAQGWSGLSEQPAQAAPAAHQHGSHHQHGAAPPDEKPEGKKAAPPPAPENAPAAQEHQGHHHGH